MTPIDPPDPPVRLPVEDALANTARRTRAAAVPLLFRLLPFLRRQWWRDRFVENPLLKRELQIHLRRPLTSPACWMVGILMAQLVITTLGYARALTDMIEIARQVEVGPSSPIPSGTSPSTAPWWDQYWLSAWLTLFAPFVLGLTVGRTWEQEREIVVRDSLTVAPFTIRQLMGARVNLWVVTLLAFGALTRLVSSTLSLAGDFVMKGSDLGLGLSPICWHLLWLAPSVAWVFALVGFVTRCSIHRLPAFVVGVVSMIFAQLLMLLPSLLEMVLPMSFQSSPALLGYQLFLGLVPPLAVAILTWRGLAARIARDYPLAP